MVTTNKMLNVRSGTRTDVNPQINTIPAETEKQKCIAQGGSWDEANQTCILVKSVGKSPIQNTTTKQETPTQQDIQKVTEPQTPSNLMGGTLRDAQGNIITQTKESLEADRLEIARLKASEGGIGSKEALLQKQEQQKTQERNAQLLQMAQNGLLSQDELQTITGAKLDVGQALGAGVAGSLPGVVGGAATGLIGGALGGAAGGAIAGTAVTPVIGTAIGAALGAVGGFLVAVRSNIKSQQTGEFAADQTALTKGDRYLRSLITDTNKNPQNAPENIALFYQTLNNIDAAHAKTWRDSQEDLNKWLGNDGTPQLAKFDTFDATMRQYYISQMETALLQPDNTRSLITEDDLNDYLSSEEE